MKEALSDLIAVMRDERNREFLFELDILDNAIDTEVAYCGQLLGGAKVTEKDILRNVRKMIHEDIPWEKRADVNGIVHVFLKSRVEEGKLALEAITTARRAIDDYALHMIAAEESLEDGLKELT